MIAGPSQFHDATYIDGQIDLVLGEIKLQYVVKVVADNMANLKKRSEPLMDNRQFILDTLAHCLDLMKDIGDIAVVKGTKH